MKLLFCVTVLATLVVGVTVEETRTELASGTTSLSAENRSHPQKPTYRTTTTCSANGTTCVTEQMSNHSSVETWTSNDNTCKRIVRTNYGETTNNISFVQKFGNIVITTTSSVRTQVTESVTTTIEVMEPPSTTTPALPTSTEPPSNLHCLFVGDLLNFGTDSAAYQKEKNFIIKIGEKLFDSSQGVSAGIWAYGYTKRVSLVIKNDAMHHNFEEFSKAADAEMQLQNKKILSNERVITVLNSCNDPQRSANCLVFFSGVDDVSVWKKKSEDNQDEYQKLNMTRNAKMTRIVAVGLKSVDLSKIVIPTNGKAVKVSKSYSDDDVSEVVKAILKEPVEE